MQAHINEVVRLCRQTVADNDGDLPDNHKPVSLTCFSIGASVGKKRRLLYARRRLVERLFARFCRL